MATHSSIFAWKIAWTEDLGSLQSMYAPPPTHTQSVHYKNDRGEEPRWQRNRTGRPLSPLPINQKNI